MRGWRVQLVLLASMLACRGDDVASGDAGASGTTGSGQSTTETGKHTTGSTSTSSGAGEPRCFREEWAWTSADTLGAVGGLALPEPGVVGLGLQWQEGTWLLSLGFDGQPAWGPSTVDSTTTTVGDIAVLPSGELGVVRSTATEAVLERWSAEGTKLDSSVLAGGLAHATDVAVTDSGALVVGGFIGEFDREGEALILGAQPDGTVDWELRGPNNFVLDVAKSGSGSALALTVAAETEGGVVYLESVSPSGEREWSELVGNNTGFGSEFLSPFAVTSDGADGALLLGTDGEGTVVLSRRDSLGGQIWESDVPIPPPAMIPLYGDIAVFENHVIATASGSGAEPTALLAYTLDGASVCVEVTRDPEEQPHGTTLAVHSEDIIIAGGVRIPGGLEKAWMTRYSVHLP